MNTPPTITTLAEISTKNLIFMAFLRTEISLAGMERSELEEKMERLEQDHRDALEDKKIVEKKGQGLLKVERSGL